MPKMCADEISSSPKVRFVAARCRRDAQVPAPAAGAGDPRRGLPGLDLTEVYKEELTPYFPYSTKIKKEFNDTVQPWGIHNLTDLRRHAQYCSFPPVDPVKFQPPSIPIICRYFCSQQFGELVESN